MTEPRDDLLQLIARNFSTPRLVHDALLAAYPQLAALSQDTNWGVFYGGQLCSRPYWSREEAEGAPLADTPASRIKARIVYATPWEDAP